MKKNVFFVVAVLSILFVDCAKKGHISGGKKDTLPPEILFINPANFSTEFKNNHIEIEFDEYVKIENINQNLIVSPPLNSLVEATPSVPSKVIRLKINDTLHKNTTYSFNFGQAIADNNEGNKMDNFTYVFSTGKKIDSLEVKGKVKDAYRSKNNDAITVMLYDAQTFNDSTPYSKKPLYISTVDAKNTDFTLKNVREGEFYLIALRDKNNNYLYDPKTEKIGFLKNKIKTPKDTTYYLSMFLSQKELNVSRPSKVTSNKWILPYEGDIEGAKIKILENNKAIDFSIVKIENKDSLYIFTPHKLYDSLSFEVEKNQYKKKYILTDREMKEKDSLKISMNKTGKIDFTDRLFLSANTPIKEVNQKFISIQDKDSLNVPFQIQKDSIHQKLELIFEKKEKQQYALKLLPNSIVDIYEKANDSLTFNFSTASYTDYGKITIDWENPQNQYPLIIELLDDREEVKFKEIVNTNKKVVFEHIPPIKYFVRITYDENQDGKWTTGNYKEKKYPEKIYNLPKAIELRPNWEINETIEIKFKDTFSE